MELAEVSSRGLVGSRVVVPGGVETPQFCSSDMSPQSFSPSQIHDAGIQRPVLAHWNWSSRHPISTSVTTLAHLICYLMIRHDISWISWQIKLPHTRSSAIAEGPRDASFQLKSCQLSRKSAETTCTTSPEQIEVMELKGYSGQCVINMCTQPWAIESLPLSYKCHKQTGHGRVVDITCSISTTCCGEIF